MAEWRDCKLGDVVTLKRGYDLPHQQRVPGPFPIVSSSGVTDHHAAAKVHGPGVVTGRYGTLGDVFYIEGDFWPLNTSLYVRDFKDNDRRFISYFLRQLNFGTQNAAGAVPGVNRNHLHAMDVRVPPLNVQRRIAGILTAYDELIENCERRIRVLDEMARALYREWFVDRRSPGAGIEPRSGVLGDVLTLHRGYDLPERDRQQGNVPIISSSGVTGEHNFAKVQPPCVVTGRYGTLGEVFFLSVPCWPLNTTLYVSDFKGTDPYYAYFLLRSLDLARQNAAGAVPGLNRNALHLLPVAIPGAAIQAMFGRIVAPKIALAEKLAADVHCLRRTRDLLLPRLLSGQLSVEDAA
jgi:type I restriction enzyme S subunit